MKITNKKNLTTNKILTLLEEKRLDDSIEILANVFIRLGLNKLKNQITSSISPKNIAQIILEDVKQSGDTLGNTLARQGLVILSWLEKDNNDKS